MNIIKKNLTQFWNISDVQIIISYNKYSVKKTFITKFKSFHYYQNYKKDIKRRKNIENDGYWNGIEIANIKRKHKHLIYNENMYIR